MGSFELVTRVEQALSALGVSNGPLVVGLSGGPDSLCLLHALAKLAPRLGLELEALHIDHGLRQDSSEDARQAVALAAGLGVRCDVTRASPRPAQGENIQQWARQRRLEALGSLARELGARWVALAHTASDQAETLLMRIIRGTGVAGLGGMAQARPLLPGVALVRPLLEVTRAEVEAALAGVGASPIEDPSNRSPAYFRNRVRRELVPLLARDNPEIIGALVRLAASAREQQQAMTVFANRARGEARRGDGLAVEALAALQPGLLHEVLRLEWERAGEGGQLERKHLLALAALVREPDAGTRSLSLPGKVASRAYGTLRLDPGTGRKTSEPVGFDPLVVAGEGRHRLSDGRWLEVRWVEPPQAAVEPTALAESRVRFPLEVRPPQAGERLTLAAGQRKKISRLLIDEKVPRGDRWAVPVVLLDGEPLLVVGVRRGDDCRPSESERALVVRFCSDVPPEM